MPCRFDDNIAPYILGCLPDEDARLMKEHLACCSDCDEVALDLESTALSLLMVPEIKPPRRMKATVMSQVQAQAELFSSATSKSSRWRWFHVRPVFAAGALAAVFAAFVTGNATHPLGERSSPAVSDKVTTIYASTTGLADGGEAYLLSNNKGISVHASGLPHIDKQNGYRVWAEDRSGKIRDTKINLDVNANGDAVMNISAAKQSGIKRILVTRQPRSSTTPQTRSMVFNASVPAAT